jgi:hypothetical protein
MRSQRTFLTTAVLTTVLAVAASAQTTVQTGRPTAASPHVKTTWTISGATVSIEYGRPYLKGRSEAQMMPIGAPWRTGADEATVITSNKPLTFGTIKLEPGSYTINTQPGEKEWQLILGKLGKAGQWGVPYLSALEIGRVPMKLTKNATPVEQVTYTIDNAGGQTSLRIEWGTVRVSTPFSIGK